MADINKTQAEILNKLGIESLNPMQHEAASTIRKEKEIVLLSPTGTGKTLAFLLPIVLGLDVSLKETQALIVAPSRELALQIEQVARDMGSGLKINVFYGGRNFSKDRAELTEPPAILVGTPGRIADHFRRGTVSADHIKTVVLDEFDKSLEIGFENDMLEIMDELVNVEKKILTSATSDIRIPLFVELKNPTHINYLDEAIESLSYRRIVSPKKDKLEALVAALRHLGEQPGIVFCNFKSSIQRVSDFLTENGIEHGCFFGGMEQKDRERALIKFRNGTHRLLLATDLAARGIDVSEIKFIIHYHLPVKEQEFVHRNGRTARMHQEGTAYVLHWEKEELPEFIHIPKEEILLDAPIPGKTGWTTLFISGGRKDKVSKGDIAGLFFKQGELEKGELGVIELKTDCAFVSVPSGKAKMLVKKLTNTRLKKKKVRIVEV